MLAAAAEEDEEQLVLKRCQRHQHVLFVPQFLHSTALQLTPRSGCLPCVNCKGP
jgi:hypothetical protein